MKILVLGLNFYPELTGVGKYTGEMVAWLTSHGFEVRVVTAPPYYPAWKIGDGYAGYAYRREVWKDAVVYRCPLWVPQSQSGLKRILHLCSFAVSSLPPLLAAAVTWRPHLVFVVAPTFMSTLWALLAARLAGAKSWLHIQDFEVDAAFELGLLKNQGVRSLVSRCESWLMRRFDRVSTISTNMVKRLADKGVAQEQAILFPNWVDVETIHPDQEAGRRFRAEQGISDESFLVLYSGNMGEKQGLDILIDVATAFGNHPEVLFVLCGEGAAKRRLVEVMSAQTNVRFLPLQPFETLNAMLNAADVHILPQRADAADLVMPSKLTGILASGRPVLACAHPKTALAQVVSDAGGLLCEPENAFGMYKQILTLLEGRFKYGCASSLTRKYAVTHFGEDAILEQVAVSMKMLTPP